jgi:hypothetical protein
LCVDVAVPGTFAPAPLPEASATSAVVGYAVELAGAPAPGSAAQVTLTVTRDGEPVDDLGAFADLVAIRSRDLAYLHVHLRVSRCRSSRWAASRTIRPVVA